MPRWVSPADGSINLAVLDAYLASEEMGFEGGQLRGAERQQVAGVLHTLRRVLDPQEQERLDVLALVGGLALLGPRAGGVDADGVAVMLIDSVQVVHAVGMYGGIPVCSSLLQLWALCAAGHPHCSAPPAPRRTWCLTQTRQASCAP